VCDDVLNCATAQVKALVPLHHVRTESPEVLRLDDANALVRDGAAAGGGGADGDGGGVSPSQSPPRLAAIGAVATTTGDGGSSASGGALQAAAQPAGAGSAMLGESLCHASMPLIEQSYSEALSGLGCLLYASFDTLLAAPSTTMLADYAFLTVGYIVAYGTPAADDHYRSLQAPPPQQQAPQQHELVIVARSHRPVGLMRLRQGAAPAAAGSDAATSSASLGQEWTCVLRFENATSR
jgi:hypothetical protein